MSAVPSQQSVYSVTDDDCYKLLGLDRAKTHLGRIGLTETTGSGPLTNTLMIFVSDTKTAYMERKDMVARITKLPPGIRGRDNMGSTEWTFGWGDVATFWNVSTGKKVHQGRLSLDDSETVKTLADRLRNHQFSSEIKDITYGKEGKTLWTRTEIPSDLLFKAEVPRADQSITSDVFSWVSAAPLYKGVSLGITSPPKPPGREEESAALLEEAMKRFQELVSKS